MRNPSPKLERLLCPPWPRLHNSDDHNLQPIHSRCQSCRTGQRHWVCTCRLRWCIPPCRHRPFLWVGNLCHVQMRAVHFYQTHWRIGKGLYRHRQKIFCSATCVAGIFPFGFARQTVIFSGLGVYPCYIGTGTQPQKEQIYKQFILKEAVNVPYWIKFNQSALDKLAIVMEH